MTNAMKSSVSLPQKVSTLAEAVSRHPFVVGAAPMAVSRLAGHARLLEGGPGQLLVDSEEAGTDVYLVLRGEVRVFLRTPAGRRAILADVRAGGILGEMAAIDNRPRSASIVALTRTRLAAIPAMAFLDFVHEEPPACDRLLRILTTRIREGNERLLLAGAVPGRVRLYAELLRLAAPRTGDARLVVTPPPTQADLAARIGIRREAVSREMAALGRERLVIRSRSALVITEPEILRRRVAAARDGTGP